MTDLPPWSPEQPAAYVAPQYAAPEYVPPQDGQPLEQPARQADLGQLPPVDDIPAAPPETPPATPPAAAPYVPGYGMVAPRPRGATTQSPAGQAAYQAYPAGGPGYGFLAPKPVPPADKPSPGAQSGERARRERVRLRTAYIGRDVSFLLAGIALVVLGIKIPGGLVTVVFGILTIIGAAAMVFLHARSQKVEQRSRAQRIWFSCCVLVAAGWVFLAFFGLTGIGGQTATATTGNCVYVPAHSTYSSGHSHTTPAHYACYATVTWPDGSTNVEEADQKTGHPIKTTFAKPPPILGGAWFAGARMPWQETLAFLVLTGLTFLHALLSLGLAIGRRPRRADSRGKTDGLPPGTLPS